MKSDSPLHRAPSEFSQLARRILATAFEGEPLREYLDEIGRALLDFTGSDEVETWLLGRNEGVRHAVCRGSEAAPSCASHIRFSLPWESAGPLADYDRICRAILDRSPSLPRSSLTEKRSFLVSRAGHGLRDGCPETGAPPQGYDLSGTFKSLLVIPFEGVSESHGKENGLLALKSRQSGFFDSDAVALLEEVAEFIGLAVGNRRTHASLRERVKELTCLYKIALLVEQPKGSLEEVLQGVVEILPGALLYPDDAWACLRIDNCTYQTKGMIEAGDRMSAQIVVAGSVRGYLEVGYAAQKPASHAGPFLREERSLLETVAKEVALVVERRDIEEKSQQLRQQLLHAERLATVGELSSGIAHELNDPLNNILGFAQLARKAPDISDQVAQDLDRIVVSALHTRKVIQQLLLFARRMPQRRTQLDLNQLIEESYSFLQTLCSKSKIDLVAHLTPVSPVVSADPDQIRQVLVNLVVNASQAMPNGGKLTITTGLSEGRECALLIVEDTGIGMNKETIENAFAPFFTTKESGTGLGLAVAEGIVSSHDGTIHVASESGKGSRFEVRLPQIQGRHPAGES